MTHDWISPDVLRGTKINTIQLSHSKSINLYKHTTLRYTFLMFTNVSKNALISEFYFYSSELCVDNVV
ncbi:CLUMA_CG007793, isoform A [Clunio marinus]|uniref:CLUMA_CG007793, isoform A n=1 Tax=Clunio marinus TaxID=568069 RepID=A0A1J1I5R7_9DIPT|nr:CLUMA_CG007793, isoform A [Clunio marinus]